MTPRPQLSHSKVGDTVKLQGALADKKTPLFIGRINEDGYYFLWRSQKAFELGNHWDHAAAGSHGVA